MNPKTTLAKAANLIDDRGAGYGGVEQSFTRAAQIATLITGVEMTPANVALIVLAVKLARRVQQPQNADHYLDGINYLAFAHDFELGDLANNGIVQPLGYVASPAPAALNALTEIRRPDAAKIEAARERALGAGLLPEEDETARIARSYAPKKPAAAE